jgi:hypothetical protein
MQQQWGSCPAAAKQRACSDLKTAYTPYMAPTTISSNACESKDDTLNSRVGKANTQYASWADGSGVVDVLQCNCAPVFFGVTSQPQQKCPACSSSTARTPSSKTHAQ